MVDAEARNSCLAVDGEGLSFRFGGAKSACVLNGLNIAVERGIIYGLLGPSGCGKTTLLRCFVGRHKPSSGTIKIFGNVPGQSGFSVPGSGVGFMPQELALYPEISTEETLTYFGRLYQMERKDIKKRIDFLAEFLDIPDKKKLIKHLSGGQQRRVSFAAALIHKPPLLILDEPTVGVDPLLRRNIWNHLQNLATRDHMTIIITTHYVEEARQAHVIGFMREGHLLAEDNPEILINKYSANTLEGVFLKLCVKESDAEDAFGEGTFEMGEKNGLTNGSHDEVWIRQKKYLQENRTKCNVDSVVNSGGYEHYKATLLNKNNEDIDLRIDDTCCGQMRKTADRMGALIQKNFTRLRRNIPLVFFQLFVPAFQVIVFCLCVGGEPYDLPMAVVNLETDPAGHSNKFLQKISSHTIHQQNFTNFSLALESVKRGENWGIIHIGPTFTDSLINRYLEGTDADNETIEESTIKIYLDKTNQQIAATIYAKLLESFQAFSESMLKQFYQNPLLSQAPIKTGPPIYGNEKPNFTEFMAPGMILGITYMMAVGLSAMSIIIEKKEGLLDRSWIAGVRSWEVVFSILFTLFTVMLLQVALVLLFTFLAFSIPSRGFLLWAIIAVLLVGLEGMSYGLFISAICNDENIAVMIAMGSFYPNLLISGIIWPVEAMPYWLRQLSYCLPLNLISHTMRCVLSRGWDITENGIWVGYLVAVAWIVPVIILSSLLFKLKK